MLDICIFVYGKVCINMYIIYIYANGKNTIQYITYLYTLNIKENKCFKYKKGLFQKNIGFSNIL